MSFNVSEKALLALEKNGNHEVFFRVKVVPGGCFGFQYDFSFEDSPEPDDLVQKKDNISILIDPLSLPFLKDSVLDYKEEMMSSFFFIENPNAQNSCGCKNSFAFDPAKMALEQPEKL